MESKEWFQELEIFRLSEAFSTTEGVLLKPGFPQEMGSPLPKGHGAAAK